MKPIVLAAALVAAVLAAPALANDSTAELAAGGLVLTTTDAIEMKSEDLFISQGEVWVKYRFLNSSGKDVTTRVAFPMPDIGGDSFPYQDSSIPNRTDPANLLGFKTTVDGKPVRMAVEQKVFAKGVDRTAWLTKRGMPLGPHLADIDDRLETLSMADKEEAVKLGLVVPNEMDDSKPWMVRVLPVWTLKTTFHWEQTFPAGREIVVEHRYRPAVGGSAGTVIGAPGFMALPEWKAMRNAYCIDTQFLDAVKAAQGTQEYSPFFEARIAYILKTGGNWAKPIGDFRMVIDKGSAKHLVSFCGSDVKKIGPTRFEMRKTNWRPTRDLNVLILKPIEMEPE